MGVHAFDTEPEHCGLYRAVDPEAPPLLGYREGWNMPAVRHRRAFNGGIAFPGVGHFVATLHFGGAAARLIGEGTTDLVARTGGVSLQPPERSVRLASGGAVDYAHLYFRRSIVQEIADEMERPESGEIDCFFGIDDRALAADVTAYVARAGDVTDPPTALEMDERSYVVGRSFLRLARRRSDRLASLAPISRREIGRVLEAIEDRIAEPLRLSELAGLVKMSPFHFARVFRAETGETPARWVMRRRAERAVEMIAATDLPLAEIAFRTGFSSQSHMTRRVRMVTGKTPGAIRG